ncbi:hypothetical protein SDC9_62701 [bioreactor metagenome]|uniref:Uncharacterized protein n=1 Tax=bioreactor metagenome TaxID=1076179 RepID=A0A644XQ05_9ZZZZ
MSRDIIGTMRLAARYFPESPETVSDVLQVEIRLRAEELFREGQPVAGAYAVILGELPDSISAEDRSGILKIITDAWRQYRLEGGDRLVRNRSRDASTK